MSEITMNAAGGARVEYVKSVSDLENDGPDKVKFGRTADGKISVAGNPNPTLVAKAIKRAKAKRAERRKAIGSGKAQTMKARMRRKLAQAGA